MTIQLLKPHQTLDDLGALLDAAKAAERKAADHRRQIEEQIIAVVGAKPEGAYSVKGDVYQITTTGKMTRSIDESKYDEVAEKIPTPLLNRLFRWKPSLNVKELKYVENNEPEYYKIVARCIETKPAKTAVAIKKLEA